MRLNICIVVLLPALKPACSSAIITSACGWSLFRTIFSMTLLGWLIRPMILSAVLAQLQVAFLWECDKNWIKFYQSIPKILNKNTVLTSIKGYNCQKLLKQNVH